MPSFLEIMQAKPQVRTQKSVMMPVQRVGRINTFVAAKRLKEALECDSVLSQATCLRYFGGPPVWAGVWARTLDYVPINVCGYYARVTSYQLKAKRKLPNLRVEQFQHLLGVAEMRGMLGAATEDWDNQADRLGVRLRPDAVWKSPQGDVAIEFDTGSYRRSVVWDKIKRFEKDFPAGIFWGVTELKRAERLQRSFPGVQVMLVDFYGLPGVLPDPYWGPGQRVQPPDFSGVITLEEARAFLAKQP